MAAANVQIADAVKAVLEESVALAGGTIDRGYVPVNDLADDALLVSVVPTDETRAPATRRSWSRDYLVSVAVWHRMPTSTITPEDKKAWIDERMQLVQSLADLLEDNPLSADPSATFPLDAVCVLVEVDTAYDPERLDEDRLLEAEIIATYRTRRDP